MSHQTKSPLVSIIMPAYNAEQFIEQAVDSILKQTYTNIELLICDDGSTDCTAEIIRSFSDARIRKFFNEKNVGNLKTSNFLFGQCQGEFIGIQDADDWSDAERIQRSVQVLASNENIGIVGTNYVMTYEYGHEISCGYIPTTNEEIQKRMETEVPPILCASVLVKKKVADRVGYYRSFFNRIGSADFDWIYRICEVTEASNIPETLYFYRRQSQSFTASFNPTHILSQRLMHKALVKSHHFRLQGKADLFETNSRVDYRKYISEIIRTDAEQYFWQGNKLKAIHTLRKSIQADPRNMSAWKSLFYIVRN